MRVVSPPPQSARRRHATGPPPVRARPRSPRRAGPGQGRAARDSGARRCHRGRAPRPPPGMPTADARTDPLGGARSWPPPWRDERERPSPQEIGGTGGPPEPGRSDDPMLPRRPAATCGKSAVTVARPRMNFDTAKTRRSRVCSNRRIVTRTRTATKTTTSRPGKPCFFRINLDMSLLPHRWARLEHRTPHGSNTAAHRAARTEPPMRPAPKAISYDADEEPGGGDDGLHWPRIGPTGRDAIPDRPSTFLGPANGPDSRLLSIDRWGMPRLGVRFPTSAHTTHASPFGSSKWAEIP